MVNYSDPRQNEIATAQNNPSIISNLVGASNPAPMSPPPAPAGLANPPTSLADINQTAQDMSAKLYGSGFVQGGDNQREAQMQELFNLDKQLESKSSPFPQMQGYVDNPADLSRGYSGMSGMVAGNVGASTQATSTIEKSYLDATQSVVSQLMSYLQLQEQRRMREEDRKDKEEEAKLEREKFEWEKSKYNSSNGGSGRNSLIESILGVKEPTSFAPTSSLASSSQYNGPAMSTLTPGVSKKGIDGKDYTSTGSGWEPGESNKMVSDIAESGERKKYEDAYSKAIDAYGLATTKQDKDEAKDAIAWLKMKLEVLPTGELSKDDSSTVQQLRGEYIKASQPYVLVRDSYNTVKSTQDTKEGDLALIYSYVKILDPGSVVREGEIALSDQAPAAAQQIAKQYSRVWKGRLLSPSVRKNMKAQAKGIYDAALNNYKGTIKTYQNLSKQYGVDPKFVTINLEPEESEWEVVQ